MSIRDDRTNEKNGTEQSAVNNGMALAGKDNNVFKWPQYHQWTSAFEHNNDFVRLFTLMHTDFCLAVGTTYI